MPAKKPTPTAKTRRKANEMKKKHIQSRDDLYRGTKTFYNLNLRRELERPQHHLEKRRSNATFLN